MGPDASPWLWALPQRNGGTKIEEKIRPDLNEDVSSKPNEGKINVELGW